MGSKKKPVESAARARQRANAWKVAAHAWRSYADGRGSWSDAVHAESNALAFELQGSKGETRPVVAGSYVRHPPKSLGPQVPADKTPLSADELERARRIDFLNRWEADDASPAGPNVVHMGAASVGVARRAICSDCYASGVTLRVPPAACPLCGSRSVLVGPPLSEAESHGAKWPTRASAIAARGARASGQNLARPGSLPPVASVAPSGGEVSALVELQRGRQAGEQRRMLCERDPTGATGPLAPYGLCGAHKAPLNAAGHCDRGLSLRAVAAGNAACPSCGSTAVEPAAELAGKRYAGPVDYLGGRGDRAIAAARTLLGEHVGLPVVCPSCGTTHPLEAAGLCPSCGAPVLVVRDPPAAVPPSAPSAAAPGGAPASEPGRGAAPLGKIANSVSRANARTDGSQDGGPRPLPWSPDDEPSPVPAADCLGRCECGSLRVAGVPLALCRGCEAFVEWLVARGGEPS